MSKYTTLETSKKLYEAFPEWEKRKNDTEMHWIAGIDYPTQFVYDNCCWRDYGADYICPAYDTDYLLEKLPPEIESKEYEGAMARLWLRKDAGFYFAYYFVAGKEDVASDIGVHADTPVEALAALALELKKEGIL